MREPSEAGARLLGRNRLPGTRLEVPHQTPTRGSVLEREALLKKLDVSAPHVMGKKKKRTQPTSDHEPALPVLRFQRRCQTPL